MDEAIKALLITQSFLYSYHSRAFAAKPDESFLDVVQNSYAEESWAMLDGDGGKGMRHQHLLAASLKESCSLSGLQSEYTKLFVGPAQLPAPPWESVFVSKEALLFQENTLAVRESYRSAGFQSTGYPHEPDDHVATELSFMAALSKRAMESFEQGDVDRYRSTLLAQSQFLEEHLLVWIRKFSDRLNEVDGISSFYPSFASLAALVCERDAEVTQELLAAA